MDDKGFEKYRAELRYLDNLIARERYRKKALENIAEHYESPFDDDFDDLCARIADVQEDLEALNLRRTAVNLKYQRLLMYEHRSEI